MVGLWYVCLTWSGQPKENLIEFFDRKILMVRSTKGRKIEFKSNPVGMGRPTFGKNI
jgi:hypothetical protein